jgi:hypothetical protein
MKLAPIKKQFHMINNTIFGNHNAKAGSFDMGKIFKAGISRIEGCHITQHKDGKWSIEGGYKTRQSSNSHRR